MAVKAKTMEIIKSCRCADICDAMDGMGLQGMYHMNPDMRPMIPKTQFTGIARTIEFVPTNEKMPYMSYEEFEKLQYKSKFEGGYHFMSNLGKNIDCKDVDAFFESLNKGDVIVTACHGKIGGIWGSENTMNLMTKYGVAGYVFDGFMRDTPEAIEEKIPVFSTGISFVHPMGRMQIAGYDHEVECAGVTVKSGDIICADHDGIMVIPEEYADEVAYRCYKVQQIDRVNRRNNYIQAGMELDATVELLPDIDRWF